MLSLKNIATVKSAVVTSLNPELKREILCAPGSEYDINKSAHQYFRNQQWFDIIDKKARMILSRETLPKDLIDNVVNFLPAIGLKMLIWAEYHEGTLGLTRDYSLQFLRYSHFTKQGVVDRRKTAEDMMNSEDLNTKQKYKIACIYFFLLHINPLYEEILKNGQGSVSDAAKWLEKPDVVKFWSSIQPSQCFEFESKTRVYTHGILRGVSKRMVHRRRIFQAVRSGCMSAVQCVWENSKRWFPRDVQDAISSAGPMKMRSEYSDWIIFRDRRYDDAVDDAWVPRDYYDDIFRFIFSKAIEIVQPGIRPLDYIHYLTKNCVYLRDLSSLLELFLRWPYQDQFLKIAEVMWERITGETYAALLLKICCYIEPHTSANMWHGEEKCYNYRYLLKEFWSKSPDRCKRYCFVNTDYIHLMDWHVAAEDYFKIPVHNLFGKLLSQKKFTQEDEEIIRLILSCITDEEMKNVMYVSFWKRFFIKKMYKEKFEIFDRFFRVFFQSRVKAAEFRGKLQLNDALHFVCINFLKHKKLDALKSLIERLSLTENELDRLKMNLLRLMDGKIYCWELIWSEGIQVFESVVAWFPSSGEKLGDFKKRFCQKYSVGILANLIKAKQWSEADKYCEWTELTELEISRLKMNTLTSFLGTWHIFQDLVFIETDDEAKKLENIDAMLRWHLTDTTAVLEFRNVFLRKHVGCNEDSLDVFKRLIENYLVELSVNQKSKPHIRYKKSKPHSRNLNHGGEKRKSSTSSPPKKACLPQPRKEKEEKPVNTERRRSQRLLNRLNKK